MATEMLWYIGYDDVVREDDADILNPIGWARKRRGLVEGLDVVGYDGMRLV
jgi:hypothetical protein